MNGKTNIRQCYGIDFGTTSSATFGYKLHNNEVAEERPFGDDRGYPLPSVVAIDKKSGEVFTGREAWAKRTELADTCECIPSIKMILGGDRTFDIAGKIWTTTDIATELFKALKKNVEGKNKEYDLNHATAAVPIGFDAISRKRLLEAAGRAGIHIEALISEPTAAFFANFSELKSASLVAVFDWGGGTLDVAILKHEKGKVSELATGGMKIAGDVIDEKIARRIHDRIARKKGMQIAFDDMPAKARDKMLVEAEQAKRTLSDDDTADISIYDYGKMGECYDNLEYDWFRDIIAPEVDKAIQCLKDTIKQSGLGTAEIDRILLVGGSSNLQPLREKLEELYPDKLYAPEETMWSVGIGAAMLNITPGDYYSNQSFGLKLNDDSYYELLPKDVPLKDWQTECSFALVNCDKEARFVFAGSQDIEEDSRRYKTISTYGFLEEEIKIQAMVNDDLILQIKAQSSMYPKRDGGVSLWEYPRLKCYYKLPKD